MSAVTIRQLEIFVQIVETGSFRRSAEKIGITQVSISDHIQSLERQLGCRLFDRKPGAPAQVTPAGEKVYVRALRILSELSAMEWEFSPDRRGAPRRRLTLATQGFVLRNLYGDLERFRADNPQVSLTIRLEPLGYAAMAELLEADMIDIAYFMAVDDPGLFPSQFVSYEPVAIYIRPDHPLAGKSRVSVGDLKAYRVLRLGPLGHLRAAVDEVLVRCGLGAVETALETDEYGLILNALMQSDSFACMLSGKPGERLPHGDCLALPLDFPLPPLQLREAYAARGARDPAVRSLAQRIREWQLAP